MAIRLGDVAPDFTADTTEGTLSFYDYLGDGWGINGHVGHTDVRNFSEASYGDYRLGVTKDLKGFVFGATLVGTNAKDACTAGAGIQPYCLAKADGAGIKTLEAGKSTVVLSVIKTL